jgi:hypothetical protein
VIAASKLVQATVEESDAIEVVVLAPGDEESQFGPEFRVVQSMGNSRNHRIPVDGLILYLPSGDGPCRLLDEFVVNIDQRRWRTMWILGFSNVIIVLIAVALFYGKLSEISTNIDL